MFKKILRSLPSPIYQAGQWLAFGLSSRQKGKIQAGMAQGLFFNSFRGSAAYLKGENESHVQAFLAEHLKTGDVFYDIGANIGFFSVLAAQLVGAEGFVYAFEALMLNCACIERNRCLNHFEQMDILQYAVSNQDGTMALQVTYHAGGASLVGASQPADAYRKIIVNTIKLDTFIQRPQIRVPNLVKIDVEGAEYQVLQGMQRILREHRPIILYELDGEDSATVEQKARDCQALLEAAGYRIEKLPDAYPDIAHHVAHFAAFPNEAHTA